MNIFSCFLDYLNSTLNSANIVLNYSFSPFYSFNSFLSFLFFYFISLYTLSSLSSFSPPSSVLSFFFFFSFTGYLGVLSSSISIKLASSYLAASSFWFFSFTISSYAAFTSLLYSFSSIFRSFEFKPCINSITLSSVVK